MKWYFIKDKFKSIIIHDQNFPDSLIFKLCFFCESLSFINLQNYWKSLWNFSLKLDETANNSWGNFDIRPQKPGKSESCGALSLGQNLFLALDFETKWKVFWNLYLWREDKQKLFYFYPIDLEFFLSVLHSTIGYESVEFAFLQMSNKEEFRKN